MGSPRAASDKEFAASRNAKHQAQLLRLSPNPKVGPLEFCGIGMARVATVATQGGAGVVVSSKSPSRHHGFIVPRPSPQELIQSVHGFVEGPPSKRRAS